MACMHGPSQTCCTPASPEEPLRTKPCAAGVAESVLARVLDAFQAHMNGLLFGSAVQGLVANGTLARLMAAEPAASLAGDPVAFLAGRPGDSIDAFVTEVVTAGGDPACRLVRQGPGCATTSKYMPVAVVLRTLPSLVRVRLGICS